MTDEELVFAARQGDKEAETELFNRYIPRVNSIVARFFLNGGEREDLVQEGMVGLFSAINSFEKSGASFSTYACACIRNSVVDAVKKMRSDKHSALNNFVPIVEISDYTSPISPEDEVIRSESRGEFLEKISKVLSNFEFKVIIMYLDGMGVSKIAKLLQKPQKSISNSLARSKQKLTKLY